MKKIIYLTSLLLLAACNEAPPIIITKPCALDQPIANSIRPAAEIMSVDGWVFDNQTVVQPERIRIQFTSTNLKFSKTFEAKQGIKRTDLVTAYSAPNAELSGFHLEVPGNSLAPGQYEIVILRDLANATLACSNSHIVQMK
ncbi:MAG: hypothetical protein H7240_11615 [Glaciimonas sp.]|nr:hypothetical protein [Glaciimonas sp.]